MRCCLCNSPCLETGRHIYVVIAVYEAVYGNEVSKYNTNGVNAPWTVVLAVDVRRVLKPGGQQLHVRSAGLIFQFFH